MSDLRKDSFEEFVKDSLENYSSDDAPNWSEMEKRLDGAKGGSSSGSGIFNSVLSKWIAAAVVVAGLSILMVNLMDNEGSNNSDQPNEAPESFINRIRALTIESSNASDDTADNNRNQKVNRGHKSQSTVGEESAMKKVNTNGSDLSDKQTSDQVVFTKPVPIVHSGPTLDMLRAANKNNSIPDLPDPIALFSANEKQGCAPLAIRFNLKSQDVAMKYLWDFGDGTYSNEANPMHIFAKAGQYDVALTVTSLINQKSVNMLSNEPVTVFGRPEVDFDTALDENQTGNEVDFIDRSSNVVEWEWNFGDLAFSNDENPTHRYDQAGTYIVELVGANVNGCKDTVTSTIIITGKKLTSKFFAPNTFTPNGDGSNDIFKPMINGPIDLDFEMSIYNREGTVVFETRDINQGWDGRLNGSGRIAPQDTYIWLIILKDGKGNYDRQVGQITIMK